MSDPQLAGTASPSLPSDCPEPHPCRRPSGHGCSASVWPVSRLERKPEQQLGFQLLHGSIPAEHFGCHLLIFLSPLRPLELVGTHQRLVQGPFADLFMCWGAEPAVRARVRRSTEHRRPAHCRHFGLPCRRNSWLRLGIPVRMVVFAVSGHFWNKFYYYRRLVLSSLLSISDKFSPDLSPLSHVNLPSLDVSITTHSIHSIKLSKTDRKWREMMLVWLTDCCQKFTSPVGCCCCCFHYYCCFFSSIPCSKEIFYVFFFLFALMHYHKDSRLFIAKKSYYFSP